jgi:hypothetical protein
MYTIPYFVKKPLLVTLFLKQGENCGTSEYLVLVSQLDISFQAVYLLLYVLLQ